MLDNIVLYLYKSNSTMIDHQKLGQALIADVSKDLPLVQEGTQGKIDYKKKLKDEALQDGKKKGALQEFVSWMIKNGYSMTGMFTNYDP